MTAAPVTAAEQEAVMDTAQRRRDELLVAMQGEPGAALKELAVAAGWFNKDGSPTRCSPTGS